MNQYISDLFEFQNVYFLVSLLLNLPFPNNLYGIKTLKSLQATDGGSK